MKTYEKLKEIRKISGMTQEELANKLNVSRQTISKWEKGLSVPDLEMAISFCEVFQISLDDLFKEEKMEKSKTISLEDIMQVNKRNQRNLIMFMSSVFFLLTGLLALIFIFAIRYTTLNIEYILYSAISTGEYANVSLETTPFFIPAGILIAIGGIMLTIEIIYFLKEEKNENM